MQIKKAEIGRERNLECDPDRDVTDWAVAQTEHDGAEAGMTN